MRKEILKSSVPHTKFNGGWRDPQKNKKFVEYFRQELYRAIDKFVINQRAVDNGDIIPANRDEMNMKIVDELIVKFNAKANPKM